MKATYYSAGYVGTVNSNKGAQVLSFVAAAACPKCWHLQSVSWDTDVDGGIPEKAKKKIKACPVCGSPLTTKKELFVITQRTSNNAAVNLLKKQLEQKDEAPIRKRVVGVAEKAFTGKEMEENNKAASAVTSSIPVLKQYLEKVIAAESAVYFLTERVVSLKMLQLQQERNYTSQLALHAKAEEDRKKAAKRAANKEEKERKAAQEEANLKIQKWIDEFNAKDFSEKVERHPLPAAPEKVELLPISIPQKPTPPVLREPNIFNKKKVLAENARLKAQYEQDLRDYEAACVEAELRKKENALREAQYQEELNRYLEAQEAELRRVTEEIAAQKEKARISLERRIQRLNLKLQNQETSEDPECEEEKEASLPAWEAVQAFLTWEIEEAEKQLKQAAKARGKLYSYNIIHPKYRTQVAVSTFYEYLDTGRCTGLQGSDGAYSLYESECRSNLIIAQLNAIVEQLEQIKKNQVTLYRELTRINANLQSLNRSMDHVITQLDNLQCSADQMNLYLNNISNKTDAIAKSNAKIAANTEKTVQTMQVVAENTKVIAENTADIANNTAITAHYSAITAHYAKLNAELTDALGFMIALG